MLGAWTEPDGVVQHAAVLEARCWSTCLHLRDLAAAAPYNDAQTVGSFMAFHAASFSRYSLSKELFLLSGSFFHSAEMSLTTSVVLASGADADTLAKLADT
mmetsp:Transcript_32429/g.96830  ORF Transcript_32429/g.96830 Transcript_32429/m.96830 type:complete len:101 (+) Transcript_32429:114-416(+)